MAADRADGADRADVAGSAADSAGGSSAARARHPRGGGAAAGADPVKALMLRHRDLCERAVDPLEIAAGLEAHGVTDRTAARFRHRDVFSLAEEMYARAGRADGDGTPAGPPPAAGPTPARWAVRALLPGALSVLAVAALRWTTGEARPVVGLLGLLAVVAGVRAALGRGPLSSEGRSLPGPHDWRTPPGARAWAYLLVGYALLGDGLLHAGLTGGPDGLPDGGRYGDWPISLAPLLALALSCAPAAWSAHLFRTGVGRKLAGSRGLEEFAATARPLLLGVVAVHLAAVSGLAVLSAVALGEHSTPAATAALGALLLIARLLTVHGFTHAPGVVLRAVGWTEITTVCLVFAARLPGCGLLSQPVETVVSVGGAHAVPLIACGAGALVLLFHACRRLALASAHAPAAPRPPSDR
ncbi:hypothetical protein [Streptomyces fragilis]|uniref:Integral membrane protein n=1 Tax=Streptomyces fragilis TaxID=67301 RepID=A0ABV2YMS1_9ACTN|nr:hypothetical protein [Streptomyces fragilis]